MSRAPRRTKRPAGDAGPPPALHLGPLDDYIAFHLRQAQDAAVKAFAAMLGTAYQPGRFPALLVIHLNPGVSQSDVSRAIGRDKSTLSPLVRALVHEGLVTRDPSSGDRRSVHLRLTAQGEATLEHLLAQAERHEARLDVIAGAAKPDLVALLKKIGAMGEHG